MNLLLSDAPRFGEPLSRLERLFQEVVANADAARLRKDPTCAVAVFSSAFASAAWRFRDLRVINTVDATPLNIFPGIVTAQSATGFTVKTNGDTDTANYDLEYSCEL